MSKSIFVKGGVLFALSVVIVGIYIYGLNKQESKTKISQTKSEVEGVMLTATVDMVEKSDLKKTKSEVLTKRKEEVKLKPRHLYVRSDEQIMKEHQQRKIQERRMYKMREMREKHLRERKFQEMKNKRKKVENA